MKILGILLVILFVGLIVWGGWGFVNNQKKYSKGELYPSSPFVYAEGYARNIERRKHDIWFGLSEHSVLCYIENPTEENLRILFSGKKLRVGGWITSRPALEVRHGGVKILPPQK